MEIKLTQDWCYDLGPAAGEILPVMRIEYDDVGDIEYYVSEWKGARINVYPYECEEYDDITEYMENVLPDWAECYDNTGEIKVNRQLCTKDGRHIGNAFVTAQFTPVTVPVQLWKVVTDAGNSLHLTACEINELFYIGDYIAKPETIPGLRKYARNITVDLE